MARKNFRSFREIWLHMYTHISCIISEYINFKVKLCVQCFIHIKLGRQREAERIFSQRVGGQHVVPRRKGGPFPIGRGRDDFPVPPWDFWVIPVKSFQPL